MKIAIYVAIAANGVIGNAGGLPWRLSSDLKRFKATTMGKPIVMGRKTWESLPKKPLPGRANIVVTRQADYHAEGADVVRSLDAALALAVTKPISEGVEDEVCIVGGGELYRQALPFADRLYVTHVIGNAEGDTVFPPIDGAEWTAVASTEHPAGEKDSHPTRYAVYERKNRR